MQFFLYYYNGTTKKLFLEATKKMIKPKKITALILLCIYCSLLFAAISSIHQFAFNNTGHSTAANHPLVPLHPFNKSGSKQSCPLCDFLNYLSMAIIAASIYFYSERGIARNYLPIYKKLHSIVAESFYSQAPPSVIF